MTDPGKPLPDAVADSLVGVLSAIDGRASGADPRTGAPLDSVTGRPEGRRRLPNRRSHLTIEFEHAGIRYAAGVGYFADNPADGVAEVFFNVPGKAGTTIESHARDEAICASLALQHGCPVDVLQKALTRNVNGSASGALGRLLEILEAERGAA